jgi:hypothetical protein
MHEAGHHDVLGHARHLAVCDDGPARVPRARRRNVLELAIVDDGSAVDIEERQEVLKKAFGTALGGTGPTSTKNDVEARA